MPINPINLNSKVDSDLARIHDGIGTRNGNAGKFVNFCSFHRLVIRGTLFEHRTCHKVSWISTDEHRRSNHIDYFTINLKRVHLLMVA